MAFIDRDTEKPALMIAYWNGCVIAEDDYARLYYAKQPEEYSTPGETTWLRCMRPITDLAPRDQQEIRDLVAAIPPADLLFYRTGKIEGVCGDGEV